MNYFEYADAKGREVRIRAEAWNADRTRTQGPFDGTLYMSRREIERARFTGLVMSLFNPGALECKR